MNFNTGAVLKVTLYGLWNATSETRNVFQLQIQSGGPVTEAEMLDDIEAWLLALLVIVKAVLSFVQVFRGFTVETLDGNYTSGLVLFSSAQAGAVTGDAMPAGNAAFVYMNTGESRRQLRKYWPGLAESNITAGGNNSSGVLTALANAAPLFLDLYVGANASWWYCHARPGDPGSIVYPTSYTAAAVVAYQRRRRPGRGI